jgi:SAM-dependent methyltransferase
MEAGVFESWHSTDYAAQWAGEDVAARLLDLPRRLSAALVQDAGIAVEHVLDLGAGPGSYLQFMLETFPEARGTWVDSSEAMLELAETELADLADRITFVVQDVERLEEAAIEPADLVVSSRALHHFSWDSLEHVYEVIAGLTKPGGFVFDLDHVGSPDDYWNQPYRRVRAQLIGERKQELKPHRDPHALPPAEVHLERMTKAGLVYADVPWRTLMTALMMARKPE